jgi:hypothetical protein
MVLRAGFKMKLRLYVELKIYDKNRRRITGPQCVKLADNQFWHNNLTSTIHYDVILFHKYVNGEKKNKAYWKPKPNDYKNKPHKCCNTAVINGQKK